MTREAAFAASRERLHRFIVARGLADSADDILRAVGRAVSAGDLDESISPANAMFRLADRLIAERRRSSSGHGVNLVSDRLEALGERVAAVFRRHRIDGLSQHAVARELGIDLATVERDLRRAYEALVELAFPEMPPRLIEQPVSS